MTVLDTPVELKPTPPLQAASGRPYGAHETGTEPFLTLKGLTKSFGAGDRKTTVVNRVALAVAPSEFVCVLGPSGCGKTTLLRLIAGFEQADSGAIHQAGREISALPPEARDFGIVFQSYALFPNRTVAGNIAYGLEATGVSKRDASLRIAELLALVGLADHAGKYPSQISGGQQQRVALARALALSPGLLLLDEPLSALDANVRTSLRDELRALQRRVGVTTLMVTHDQHEALSIADRIVVMNSGRIEQVGPPGEVYDRPANLFVARFLGPMNALPVESRNPVGVRAGGLDLRLDAASRHPDASHLCIRPAALLVGDAARQEANRFEAAVESTTFLGDLMRIALIMPGSGRCRLEAEVHRARLSSLPSQGETMDVALPPRHCMLLTNGT